MTFRATESKNGTIVTDKTGAMAWIDGTRAEITSVNAHLEKVAMKVDIKRRFQV